MSLLSYQDPFYHSIDYSPTDNEGIDRAAAHARRVLTPHKLVLQMLFSRLQASRYHRPAIMLLIQQIVLRTAHACKSMRYVDKTTISRTLANLSLSALMH